MDKNSKKFARNEKCMDRPIAFNAVRWRMDKYSQATSDKNWSPKSEFFCFLFWVFSKILFKVVSAINGASCHQKKIFSVIVLEFHGKMYS